MGSAWLSIRRAPASLWLLLAVGLILGTAWTFATSPLTGPDELGHFAYIEHLAETGDGPQKSTGAHTFSDSLAAVGYEANLVPIIGQSTGRANWIDVGAIDHGASKLDRGNGSGPNSVANNPPLYYAYGAVAYKLSPLRSELGRVTFVRLATVLLFLLTVLGTWLLATELFGTWWPRVLATGLVVLMPKLTAQAGTVNPDVLLAVVGTWFLFSATILLRRGITVWRAAAVALLAVAGLLTHARGLYMLPVAALVLAVGALLQWPVMRRALVAAAVGVGILAVGAVVAVWYTGGHSAGAFGGTVGQATSGGASLRQFLEYVWQFYLPALPGMRPSISPAYGYHQLFVQGFFGDFGSLEVNFSPAVYTLIQDAAFVGAALVLACVIRDPDVLRRQWKFLLVAVTSFVGMLAVLHVTAYQSLRSSPDPLLAGRYLVPCVALAGIAAAWLASRMGRRLGPAFGAMLLALLVLLQIGGLGHALARFYA